MGCGFQNLVKLKLFRTWLAEVDGTMQVLGKLPNLAILRLLSKSFGAEEEEACCFISRREAFRSLTVLDLGARCGIYRVEFEEGTAPKLELLLSRHRLSFSGLSSLLSLKEVMIGGYNNNNEWAEELRAQLSRNSNKPVLKVIR